MEWVSCTKFIVKFWAYLPKDNETATIKKPARSGENGLAYFYVSDTTSDVSTCETSA